MGKLILVFERGELLRQIPYKTKREAKRQYSHFKKRGMIDQDTGEVIENLTFELI